MQPLKMTWKNFGERDHNLVTCAALLGLGVGTLLQSVITAQIVNPGNKEPIYPARVEGLRHSFDQIEEV